MPKDFEIYSRQLLVWPFKHILLMFQNAVFRPMHDLQTILVELLLVLFQKQYWPILGQFFQLIIMQLFNLHINA